MRDVLLKRIGQVVEILLTNKKTVKAAVGDVTELGVAIQGHGFIPFADIRMLVYQPHGK